MSKEEEKKVIGGTVKSWGKRYPVPADVLEHIGADVGDEVVWSFGEQDGKRIAILQKKEKAVREG